MNTNITKQLFHLYLWVAKFIWKKYDAKLELSNEEDEANKLTLPSRYRILNSRISVRRARYLSVTPPHNMGYADMYYKHQ